MITGRNISHSIEIPLIDGMQTRELSVELSNNEFLIDPITESRKKKLDNYTDSSNCVQVVNLPEIYDEYLGFYTKLDSKFKIGDIVYISSQGDTDGNIDSFYENRYDLNYPNYPDDKQHGYNVLYVNSNDNLVVTDKKYDTLPSNVDLSNHYISSVKCENITMFDGDLNSSLIKESDLIGDINIKQSVFFVCNSSGSTFELKYDYLYPSLVNLSDSELDLVSSKNNYNYGYSYVGCDSCSSNIYMTNVESGIYTNSIFNGSGNTINGGYFKDCTFHNYIINDGTFKNCIIEDDCTWNYGIWESESGDLAFKPLIWNNGIWNGGSFMQLSGTSTPRHRYWMDGIFNDGDFNGCYWCGGTFNNGDFNTSEWENGTFNDGIFCGNWKSGTFNGGQFGDLNYMRSKKVTLASPPGGGTNITNVLLEISGHYGEELTFYTDTGKSYVNIRGIDVPLIYRNSTINGIKWNFSGSGYTLVWLRLESGVTLSEKEEFELHYKHFYPIQLTGHTIPSNTSSSMYPIDPSYNIWSGGTFNVGNIESSVTWLDGTFNNGTFNDSIWYNGTFGQKNIDILDNTKFNNSSWYGGTWYNGHMNDSYFSGSTWYNGKCENSEFRYGTWYNGEFENGGFEYSTWYNGTASKSTFGVVEWYNGISQENGFMYCKWHNGTSIKSDFLSCNWSGGTFNDGTFDMHMIYGYWYGGTFDNGTFKSSYWYGGIWNDGNWRGLGDKPVSSMTKPYNIGLNTQRDVIPPVDSSSKTSKKSKRTTDKK